MFRKYFLSDEYRVTHIFILFATILILLFLSVNYIFYSDKSKRIALDNAIYESLERENTFKEFIHDSKITLISIRESKSFNNYLSTNNNDIAEELFFTIINGNKNIAQIRYLDKNGLEKLKVFRKDEKDKAVIEKNLFQDKSSRYYFKDSMKEELEKVWYSELDLNKEFGKVEVPYNPTLRAILPIGKEKSFNGILIINYFMKPFLKELLNIPLYDTILVDGEGNYIIHYNEYKNWSKYSTNKYNIKTDFEYFENDIFKKELFLSKEFVSRKLDLPISNNLYLIMQLNKKYSDREFKEELYAFMMVFYSVLLISIFTSFFISKILKRVEIKLKETEKYVKLIDENIITSTADINGIITDVSTAYSKITGYSKEELIGHKHSIVKHPDTTNETYESLWTELKNNRTWHGELRNIKKNGEEFWMDTTISPVFDDKGKKIGYTSIRHDITDKKIIETLSMTDALTSLYNRRFYDDVIPKAVKTAKRDKKLVCFIMMDVDCFKLYNDTYGHKKGDEVLIKLASVIKDFLRRPDDYAFRLGGEEFGIFFKAIKKESAYEFTEQIRKNIEKLEIEHKENSASKFVTVSMGLFCLNARDLEDIEDIYKESDKLLYEAKKAGRNKVVSNF